MTIEITQEDIDGAERANSMNCPVARAFSRIGFKTPAASTRYVVVFPESEDSDVVYNYSEELYEAVLNFDISGVFRPGTYELSKDAA